LSLETKPIGAQVLTYDTTTLTGPQIVLIECLQKMIKKSQDYQSSKSSVVQAMYYPHGINTLMDVIQTKRLRLISLLEASESDPEHQANFESIEDSLIDMANYCAIAVSWIRGELEGQDPLFDMFNRKKNT
jgi:hypothetical protein